MAYRIPKGDNDSTEHTPASWRGTRIHALEYVWTLLFLHVLLDIKMMRTTSASNHHTTIHYNLFVSASQHLSISASTTSSLPFHLHQSTKLYSTRPSILQQYHTFTMKTFAAVAAFLSLAIAVPVAENGAASLPDLSCQKGSACPIIGYICVDPKLPNLKPTCVSPGKAQLASGLLQPGTQNCGRGQKSCPSGYVCAEPDIFTQGAEKCYQEGYAPVDPISGIVDCNKEGKCPDARYLCALYPKTNTMKCQDPMRPFF
jgi:hypothetical protein